MCPYFTINVSRKSREITCPTISGINQFDKIQTYAYIHYPDSTNFSKLTLEGTMSLKIFLCHW